MLAVRQKIRNYRRSYWALAGLIMAVFSAAYGLAEAFRVPFLTNVSALTDASLLTALVTIGLLTADTLLPVPSSVVMVTNGVLFGFWVGSFISIIGNVLGFLFAYWLGRRSSPLIQSFIAASEIDRGNRVLQKWGVFALIVTRPLPILAETTAIMAGVAKLPFAKSLAATTAGSLPACILYVWAGSHAKGFSATAYIFLALIVLASIAWMADKQLLRKAPQPYADRK